ncbi:hypothetical protein PR202_ga01511 [Eleusine coracana subsp. coracana]|uniref:Uncharacterized protein n=1 Tax=Eleusine coracana subsp. coracana TaxID=191504 RepID=A0AAV5BHG5_ELECO|nr:hypothetical protein PR202_ga00824 [Eleusine coracana subsp. coracana]GJM85718.1 hypothetical protein PR202_ga01511 [Eleusine coracana subsp. coracana]
MMAGHHRRLAADNKPQQCSGGVPAGCFAVLVGPDKERFVVRARCANHPLFRALLDEAETEYGFAGCDGPLELPCAVDDFMEVMWEMEQGDPTASPGCGRFVAAGGRAGHLQMHQGHMMMSPARTFLVAGRS